MLLGRADTMGKVHSPQLLAVLCRRLPAEVAAIIAHWARAAQRRDLHAAIRDRTVRVGHGDRAVFLVCEHRNYYDVLGVDDAPGAQAGCRGQH